MFGSSPSFAAIAASKVFKRENVNNILELGGGQGRDSLFFARKGFRIDVLDYSYSGIATINKKANILNLSQFITLDLLIKQFIFLPYSPRISKVLGLFLFPILAIF